MLTEGGRGTAESSTKWVTIIKSNRCVFVCTAACTDWEQVIYEPFLLFYVRKLLSWQECADKLCARAWVYGRQTFLGVYVAEVAKATHVITFLTDSKKWQIDRVHVVKSKQASHEK